MTSPMSILVLATLLVQSLLGSLPDTVVICLGGGHDHPSEPCPAQTLAPPPCCAGCSHDDAWPAPQPDEPHDVHCGCTDIELALIDLQWIPRSTELALIEATNAPRPSPPPAFDPAGMLQRGTATPATGPPRPDDPLACDHAGVLRAHILRTTRLRI